MAEPPKRSQLPNNNDFTFILNSVQLLGAKVIGQLGDDSRPYEHSGYQIPVAGNRDRYLLCFMISHELFQDDAIEHVDMEEEASKDVEEVQLATGAAPDLDDGDEVI